MHRIEHTSKHISETVLSSLQRLTDELRIDVHTVLQWKALNGMHIVTRTQPDDLIIFPLNGSIHIQQDSDSHTITNDHIMFLPHGHQHALHSDGCTFIAIHADILLHTHERYCDGLQQSVCQLSNKRHHHYTLSNLATVFHKDPAAARQLCAIHIHSLLADLLLRGENVHHSLHSASRIDRVLSVIHQQLKDPPDIETCAALAGLGLTAFRQQFTDATGVSPKNYINQYRLSTAATLLRTTTQTAAEIAHQCGYATAAYFTRAFKQHYGQTPQTYRQTQAP